MHSHAVLTQTTELDPLFSVLFGYNVMSSSGLFSQVDAEKMSKSKGNFLMLNECVQRFSADCTR
jgi:leucyl-tRNA synthetase